MSETERTAMRDIIVAYVDARSLLRTMYEELSGNANYVEKRMIESYFEKHPDALSGDAIAIQTVYADGADAAEMLAGIDEGENTDRRRLLEVATQLRKFAMGVDGAGIAAPHDSGGME